MFSEENTPSQAVAIQEIVQDPQSNRIDAIFLNRKPLEVRYYFKANGTEEELIMINVDSLLPIFGGFRPVAAEPFETLDKLSAFVKENIHFNECTGYQYADCICHMLESHTDPEFPQIEMLPSSDCFLRHFHHACWSCVNLWLNDYLRVLILRQESKLLFIKAAEEICSKVYPSDDFEEYYNHECPEFYLRIAQRWTIPEYLLDDIIDT